MLRAKIQNLEYIKRITELIIQDKLNN
jgi:hypothetical protein